MPCLSSRQPDGVAVYRDLEYAEKGHPRNKLDLYIPRSETPLPLIVWVHGGAWLTGDKSNPPALALVTKGYAVASVNYRLSQHAVFPAQIEDVKAALLWLRAHATQYKLDPKKFGIWGSSAGGHLVALAGTSGGVKAFENYGDHREQSSRVQCVVDFYGPTDFTQMGGSHDAPDSPESKLVGGPVQGNKDKCAAANPIPYIQKDCPPFLILHGERDTTVPPSQSTLLAEALKRAGVPHELVIVKGAGHGGPGFSSEENRAKIEAFFAKHLKRGSV